MRSKVVLLGKHANCTPMAYPVYRVLFEHYVDFVTDAAAADIVVLGHPDDFNGLAALLCKLIKAKPQLKLFVISEEPLWDSTWQGDFTQLANKTVTEHGQFDFYYLNYTTTTLFNFARLPYFITTSDNYFVRYQLLFNRNKQLGATQIVQQWQSAGRLAFMAQRRTEAVYDVSYPAQDVAGLSRYRSLVAERLQGPRVVVRGQGWANTPRRQMLPDWHLAKLTEFDRRFFMLSALENTHCQQYVTEKLFDAFALVSVPLYYASSKHRVSDIVPAGSFINLFGIKPEPAAQHLRDFSVSAVDVAVYMTAQQQLAQLFSNADVLLAERLRLVKHLMALINRFS